MLKKLAFMLMFSVSAFAMHNVEVNINDTDLELNANLDLGQFNENIEPDTTFAGIRIVNGDDSHGSKKGFSNDPYYELNFLMKKPIADSGLSVGMGVKVNYTTDFSSVPLGLEATYEFPFENLVPMYLNASGYYGPKVLSFGTADRYYAYRFSYDVEIIDNGRVTIGYRAMNTNYKDSRGDYVYNKSLYFGFKFFF